MSEETHDAVYWFKQLVHAGKDTNKVWDAHIGLERCGYTVRHHEPREYDAIAEALLAGPARDCRWFG